MPFLLDPLYTAVLFFSLCLYEACNHFLILTTSLTTSGSFVSEQHRAVYRTLRLAISRRSTYSLKLWMVNVWNASRGVCSLPALPLGKGLSEQGTVIARNLLSTLAHSARDSLSRIRKGTARESWHERYVFETIESFSSGILRILIIWSVNKIQ